MNDFLKQVLYTLLGIVLAMAGFWMMIGREYVTRAEVVELMETTGPYVRDKGLLMHELTRSIASNKDLKSAIDKNTGAINSLEKQMVLMQSILERLDKNDK